MLTTRGEGKRKDASDEEERGGKRPKHNEVVDLTCGGFKSMSDKSTTRSDKSTSDQGN